MELKSTIAHTSSSDDFGKSFSLGFAFPKISPDPRRVQMEMTQEEVALAASVQVEGMDFALGGGEFGGQGDLAEEGLGHDVKISYLGHGFATVEDESPEMGDDGDDYGDDAGDAADESEIADANLEDGSAAYTGMTGFDPERAALLADELGEDLVKLAQEVARGLGSDCTPEEFFDELGKRRVELAEEDRDVELRASRLGALDRPEREASSVLRLADHGRAQLRMVEGELMLVPAGAAPQDVVEAARRARNDRLAEIARVQAAADLEVRLERLNTRTVAQIFEAQIRSNMKQAADRAKAGTPVPNARAEAVSGLRAYRKVWMGLDPDRKALIPDPATDTATKRAFARAASSRAAEARFKRSRDLGKAFPAPMVPFGGTPVEPVRQAGILAIEKAMADARAAAKACPESPAANTARSISKHPEVYVHRGEGVAHSGLSEPWFEETKVIFDPAGVLSPRQPKPLADLVAAAVEALTGRVTSRGATKALALQTISWADRLPEAERESGPDQRGASAPREYNAAHRRDAQVVTATGQDLNQTRNPGQKAAAVKRVAAALKRGEGIPPSERAWRTALSIHLGEIEDAAERLELMLQTRGRQKWADLESGAANPAELKASARALANAGRLKAIRGRTSGALYIEATEALEGEQRAELERALLRLMVSGRVPVPKGTRLARRVAAHKGVITRESRKALA